MIEIKYSGGDRLIITFDIRKIELIIVIKNLFQCSNMHKIIMHSYEAIFKGIFLQNIILGHSDICYV
jgi:hypothetical protein